MLARLSNRTVNLPDDNETIMMGDFNLPNVSWDLGIVKCPVIHQNSDGSTAAVRRQYCGSTAAVIISK